MQDRPDISELLAAARAAILDKIAPALAGEGRKEALMAANALAIVRRELEDGETMREWELTALRQLVDEDEDGAARAPQERLQILNRCLSERIRAGEFDRPGARRDGLTRFLREATTWKLRINNPKLLAQVTEKS
ncbi:MAG: hypothetical protein KJZ80_14570 [Hyphomicrobiaceae bacterium]|nr:hypothetical protein [Hyphomicrobiaceae bacterium]